MIIIIDGYNLLKQLYPKNKENLEFQKKTLIRKLGIYKKIKENIKEIIVVFDGGSLIHALREIHSGIVTLESGYNRSADDWIIEYTERYKNQEMTVISMDRNLCLSCEKNGAFSLGVFDFILIVDQVIKESSQFSIPCEETSNTIHKFEEPNINIEFDIPQSRDNIDELMNAGALMQNEQSQKKHAKNIKENHPTTSKQNKKLLKKLKKIY